MGRFFMTVLVAFAVSLCIATDGFVATASSNDQLKVERDRDKTVYSLDSDEKYDREQQREQERAWDMLKNQNLLIDGRHRVRNPGVAK